MLVNEVKVNESNFLDIDEKIRKNSEYHSVFAKYGTAEDWQLFLKIKTGIHETRNRFFLPIQSRKHFSCELNLI